MRYNQVFMPDRLEILTAGDEVRVAHPRASSTVGRCNVGDKGHVLCGHGVRHAGTGSSYRDAHSSSGHLRVSNQAIHGLGQSRKIARQLPAAGY